MLRRLAALLAREEAFDPAAEPGLELDFFPRALPVGETPGNKRDKLKIVPNFSSAITLVKNQSKATYVGEITESSIQALPFSSWIEELAK